jgi:hypothetical protein
VLQFALASFDSHAVVKFLPSVLGAIE